MVCLSDMIQNKTMDVYVIKAYLHGRDWHRSGAASLKFMCEI
jgi:hypothetical protein